MRLATAYESHILTARGWDTTHHSGPLGGGGALRIRMNPQGLWEAGFVVTKGCGDLWEDVIE